MSDFTLRREGMHLFLLTPVSPAGETWAEEHLPDDAQMFGPAIVIEHGYIGAIYAGIQADGLTVGDPG